MPHAQILNGVTLDNSQPENLLAYDKNCVAMTFSRLLGVGVYPTINFFLAKGWIKKASDLENDSAIEKVAKELGLDEKYKNTAWSAVKTGMKGHSDGRYFAINRTTNPDSTGHAFALIINGSSVGVVGNNQEGPNEKAYNSKIKDIHLVSVYGPIAT
jgi:hypothetical protein